MFTSLKDTIRHTGGQPDGKAHRVKPGRVLSTRASVSVDRGIPRVDMFAKLEGL